MTALTPKQETAAVLIASGKSCRDTAKDIGIKPETISQWRKNPYFEALVNELKMEALEGAREQLRNLSAEAVSGLKDLMENSKSDSVKLKACVEILKMCGLHNAETFGWGIGSTEATEIEKEELLRMMADRMAMGSTPYMQSFKDS